MIRYWHSPVRHINDHPEIILHFITQRHAYGGHFAEMKKKNNYETCRQPEPQMTTDAIV